MNWILSWLCVILFLEHSEDQRYFKLECQCSGFRTEPLPDADRQFPYPNEQERQPLFPRDKELAVMSNLEYMLKPEHKCIHSCLNDTNDDKLQKNTWYLSDNGWRLLATFKQSSTWINLQQHCGSAFYNIKSKQLVIVHRGTNSASSALADILETYMNDASGKNSFSEMAYAFTKLVIEKYGNAARSITVTGHSLGGWLAQACVFRFKHPNLFNQIEPDLIQVYEKSINWKTVANIDRHGNTPVIYSSQEKPFPMHLHCVSFDSPGFKGTIENTIPYVKELGPDRLILPRYLDSLDVTVYLVHCLTVGNFVNDQIGTLLRMKSATNENIFLSVRKITGFISEHSSNSIVDFLFTEEDDLDGTLEILLLEEQQTFKARIVRYFRSLITQNNIPESAKRNLSQFRMSVFDDRERKFCKFLKDSEDSLGENGGEYLKNLPSEIHPSKFKLLYDAQEIDISEFMKGKEDIMDAKDRFIEQMKSVNWNLPAFVDWCRRAYCKEYRTFLPELSRSCFSREEFSEGKLHIINVEQKKSFMCTAHIYQLWRSQVIANEVANFFLNTEKLELANKVHTKFIEEIGKLQELKLIVIECLEDFNENILWEFLSKLLPAESVIRERKVILIISKNSLERLEFRQQREKLKLLDKAKIRSVNSDSLQTTYNSLSKSLQKEVAEKEIAISGKRNTLQKFMLDKNSQPIPEFLKVDLSFAFYKDKISIGNTIPKLTDFENAYFIERKFHKIICTINKNELYMSTDKVFISCPKHWRGDIETMEERIFTWPESEMNQYNGQTFILIEESNYQDSPLLLDRLMLFAKEKNISGHSLKCDTKESNQLTWLDSFGTPDMEWLDLQHPEDSSNTLDTFMVSDLLSTSLTQLTIIADDPGKGKSIIMKKLASTAANSDSWVIYLDLQHCKEAVNELRTGQLLYADFINFIVKFEGLEITNEISSFLQALLHVSGRVHIFFDGFDEIPHELQEKVQELIKSLLSYSKARMFLASRLHKKDELQEYFHRFCYAFQDFTKSEKIEFLEKFFTSHPTFVKDLDLFEKNKDGTAKFGDVEMEIVNKYAKELVVEFESNIGEAAITLCGTPLYMYMLAAIAIEKHFICFYKMSVGISIESSFSKFPDFSNRFSFYEMFINEKFRIALEEKWHLGPVGLEFARGAVKSRLRRKHQSCAFEFIFGLKVAQTFPYFNSVEHNFDLEGLKEAGLIVMANPKPNPAVNPTKHDGGEDRFLFLHRTLAEYFAADFIVTEWTKTKQRFTEPKDFDTQSKNMKTFLDDRLFLQENKQIRYFVNELILQHESTPPEFQAIDNPEQVLLYLSQLKTGVAQLKYDCFNRTILHFIFAKVMDKELELYNYGSVFVNAEKLLDHRDIFNATPFAYLQPTRELKLAVDLFLNDVLTSSKPYHVILGATLGALNIGSCQHVQNDVRSYFAIGEYVSTGIPPWLRKSLCHEIFIEEWSHNVIDFNIAIRTNDVNKILPFTLFFEKQSQDVQELCNSNNYHPTLPSSTRERWCESNNLDNSKNLLEFTLTLGDGSRMVIAKLLLDSMTQLHSVMFSESLSSHFVEVISRNRFELFKSGIKLPGYDYDECYECDILELILKPGGLNLFNWLILYIPEPKNSDLYLALYETDFITFKRSLSDSHYWNLIQNYIFLYIVAKSDRIEGKIKVLEICLDFIVSYTQIRKDVRMSDVLQILWCWRYFTEVKYFSSSYDFNKHILIKNVLPNNLLNKFRECYVRILVSPVKTLLEEANDHTWWDFRTYMDNVIN